MVSPWMARSHLLRSSTVLQTSPVSISHPRGLRDSGGEDHGSAECGRGQHVASPRRGQQPRSWGLRFVTLRKTRSLLAEAQVVVCVRHVRTAEDVLCDELVEGLAGDEFNDGV